MSNQYIAKPTSRKEMRKVAFDMRKALHCENVLCFPIVPFIEFVLPIMVEGFVLEIVEDSELPDSVQAMTVPNERKIIVKESVYNGAVDGNGRDRMSLAHEVFHILFHHPEVTIYRHVGHNLVAYEDPEWQADAFAAELLVPYNLIENMTIEEIQIQCKVSRKCAEHQKENFNK